MPRKTSETIRDELERLPRIGEVLADRILEEFDPDRLDDVLDLARSGDLTAVKGIGSERNTKIRESIADYAGSNETRTEVSSRDRFLDLLRCPHCPGSSLEFRQMSYQCSSCGRNYHEYREIIDFTDRSKTTRGLVQDVMESPFYARLYENLMRPVLTRLVSTRSMKEEYALSTRLLELEPDSVVLDVACGTGNFTRHFARHMRAKHEDGEHGILVGLDLSWPMLERAKLSTAREGLQSWIHLLRADATKFPLKDNTFTHLHCSGALHLMEDIQGAVQNFAQVLEPGGTLVIGTFLVGRGVVRPFVKRIGELVADFHWFSRNELYDVLARTGFEVLEDTTAGDAISLKARRI